MNEIKNLEVDYVIDEFGRVIIFDTELMKQINGIGDPTFNSFNNYACKSNLACANTACKKGMSI